MIVVDASVLTSALVDAGRGGRAARERLADDTDWSAPDHLVVEVFDAIRGLTLGRRISQREAAAAIAELAVLQIGLVPGSALLDRMWELRANMTGYDAAYVAVAETLECPVVTADARWTDVPGVGCPIEVVG